MKVLMAHGQGLITNTFPSSSNPSVVYTAMLDPVTGETTCNCKGWTVKKLGKPRSCKHTKKMCADAGIVESQNPLSNTVAAAVNSGAITISHGPVFSGVDFAPKSQIIIDELPAKPAAPILPPAQVSPMLASAMPEDRKLRDYCTPEWVLEEKLDGHRLLVTIKDGAVVATSRPGATHGATVRTLPAHITAVALELMHGIYDAELFVPGGTSSDVTRLDKRDDLVLGLFDVLELEGKSLMAMTYRVRREMLLDSAGLIDIEPGTKGPVQVLEVQPVSKQAVDKIWAAGGEGAILKRLESLYQSGYRSPDWVKIKKLEAAVLQITGFKKGKLGPNSIVELKDKNGLETAVKVLNNETLALIDKDPSAWIGKNLVISYIGKTSLGAYRHPCWDHMENGN